jgi:hypothetical protein
MSDVLTQTSKNTLFFLAIGICGLLVIGYGIYDYNQSSQLSSSGMTTSGTVTEIRTIRQKGSDSFRPMIEFKTVDNNTIRFETTAKTPYEYSKGQSVTVIYAADDPSNAKIDSFSDFWMRPIIAIFIGFIFTSLGFGSIYSAYAKAKLTGFLNTNGKKSW